MQAVQPPPLNAPPPTPPCSHPLCSWFTVHRVQKKKKHCSWLCKEVCRHMTESGRCPAIQTDINGFLFLLSLTTSNPPSPLHLPHPRQHLSIHASIFCSSLLFLPISSPCLANPGPTPPLHGLVWPSLPPFTHTCACSCTRTHVSASHCTFAGLYTCSI